MSRRLAVVIVTVVLVCLAVTQAADDNSARIEGADYFSSNSYFAAVQPYRVTIHSENGVVSVLHVPSGVFLNIDTSEQADENSMTSGELPRTFRGNLTIRTRRADEVKEGESQIAADIMASAPLEIVLRNATVLVEVAEDK